ncbi:hypothetical protein AL036_11355 [Salipiger aestuarii]|nr:hypothetical protein AL036_11355 [Salipiger aestuarii]
MGPTITRGCLRLSSANWAAALVGAGIVPTPKHPNPDTRAELMAFFHNGADEADADGRTDFWGLQGDIARGLVIDGEAFVQAITTPLGPRLRLIPPEMVDASLTRELADGACIVQGVEFDADGTRVAYQVRPIRPHDQFANYAPPMPLSLPARTPSPGSLRPPVRSPGTKHCAHRNNSAVRSGESGAGTTAEAAPRRDETRRDETRRDETRRRCAV